MTAGEDALREAARRESARVYGRTQAEVDRESAAPESIDRRVAFWREHGESVPAIALRLGAARADVADAVARLEAS